MIVPGSAGYSCNKLAAAGTDFHLKRFDLILFTQNKPAPVQGLSLWIWCYDSNSRMSFEEPINPCQIHQIQPTELATYDERTPGVQLMNQI